LSTLRAHEIGSMVIKEALIRAKVQPEEVSEVIMGQVQFLSLLLLFLLCRGGGFVDWIYLHQGQDTDQRWAFVNTIINVHVS
jgi:hypothetical protein